MRWVATQSLQPHNRGHNRWLCSKGKTGSILEALGGNRRDLDSIWEETEQDYNFTRSGFYDIRIVPGDGVAIPSNAV
ncbi:hypothetical protein Tco_1178188 [Tanacetum coccineum]